MSAKVNIQLQVPPELKTQMVEELTKERMRTGEYLCMNEWLRRVIKKQINEQSNQSTVGGATVSN